MIKNKAVIIDKITGIENFLKVKSGALITCNHFNPFDNYAVWGTIKPYMGRKRLYKVIREGNYTTPPPPFGFVMRNCNTLPLSSVIGISPNLLILIYCIADGFTDVIIPTNPVLLISLSMSNVSYGKWVKWTWPIQVIVFILSLLVLFIALQIGF